MFSRGAQPAPTLQGPLARLSGDCSLPEFMDQRLLLALVTGG